MWHLVPHSTNLFPMQQVYAPQQWSSKICCTLCYLPKTFVLKYEYAWYSMVHAIRSTWADMYLKPFRRILSMELRRGTKISSFLIRCQKYRNYAGRIFQHPICLANKINKVRRFMLRYTIDSVMLYYMWMMSKIDFLLIIRQPIVW